MVEYRRLPDDRRDAFREYTSYAFRPENGPSTDGSDESDERDAPALGSRRGLYEDGAPEDADPLCVCRHYWFDAGVRGDVHPVPGLASVATPPEHRRGGYVRELLAGSLEEYRERGGRFSVLWPFRYRFYRQYGWDTCNRRLVVECDPDALGFAVEAAGAVDTDDAGAAASDGRFRQREADDYADLEPAYEAHAADYALALERDADWWRYRILSGRETDPFVYAWERDGECRGYLVYEIEGEWGDRTMRVRELVAANSATYRHLLRFCANHDSQVSTVRLVEPPDSPLLDLARDPEEIDCELETGPMVRIVDVAEALSALSYPAVEADLTVAVDDPLAPWNDRRFRLEATGGTAACEPTDDEPDARIDVGALSQLAVGYRSAPALGRAGRLESGTDAGSGTDPDDGAIETLDRLFPPTAVYLADRF